MNTLSTQVLIIGGGATGTGIARDLALRGIKCILAEQKDLNAGASGANHGLLHSGARYASDDAETASECKEEGDILKRLAPECVDSKGGIFVAVEGDNEEYIANFDSFCKRAGLPCRRLDIQEAREMEPLLSPNMIAAYETEDASVDPFKLSAENMHHAQDLGSTLLRHTQVVGFNKSNNRIQTAQLLDMRTGKTILVEPEIVVNASGAWAGIIAAQAAAPIELLFSKGTLMITAERLTQRVINRLRKASDADILVPGGAVSVIGTTSIRISTLDDIRPTVEEVNFILEEGSQMVPSLKTTRYIRAYAGVRPLVKTKAVTDDRSVSRGFALIDHSSDNVDNFVSITGGKLTTFRLMAEKTSDMVCKKLNIKAPCKTKEVPLPTSHAGQWTEPAKGPKQWIMGYNPTDSLLCDCEMVSKIAFDHIIDAIKEQDPMPDLIGIGIRSRMGKGPCQGCFCSARIAGRLYERDMLHHDQGIQEIRAFLEERWRGLRPILIGEQLMQAEMTEALYCGFMCLEFLK
ncbi:MAG: anaerobic glycerol-3-phosphate dehydrogenase subunit A [Desulfobacterales bacterium]|nr:anaerobic glycerol-3-phosphate dehydrogenase subunit A [Desulfobacterales bacterium]